MSGAGVLIVHPPTYRFTLPSGQYLEVGKEVADWITSKDDEIEWLRAENIKVLPTIIRLLDDEMNRCVRNGANSTSMPDELVKLAVWVKWARKE